MSKAYSIPHLHASGTHFEVGFEMGNAFKDRIETFMKNFDDFNKKILPYLETENGKKVFNSYLNLLNKTYPWYVDEIRGISSGSGLSFDLLFAMNLRVELMHLSNSSDGEVIVISDSSKQCSDFHLINESHFMLAHNEDSSLHVYNTSYLVTLKIKSIEYPNGKQSPSEEFTCYCYPGHIPGNAFGFNSKGFVFGVNAIYPKYVFVDRIPRQFLTRAMLAANDLEELENVFLYCQSAYGLSVNVACTKSNQSILKTSWNNEYKTQEEVSNEIIYPISWNYEISPSLENKTMNNVSKHCIIPKYEAEKAKFDSNENYYSIDYKSHFNHYERIKTDECIDISSKYRAIREKQLKKPLNAKDLLDIVSDTGDNDYPIFRNNLGKDYLKTVATAIFDMKASQLWIYFGKPNGDYDLLIKLTI